MGRGKHLIIVDCITENGPIPGAVWTFSTESKTKMEEKHAVFKLLKLRWPRKEIAKMKIQTKKQEDQMQKNKASTSGKRNVTDNSSD